MSDQKKSGRSNGGNARDLRTTEQSGSVGSDAGQRSSAMASPASYSIDFTKRETRGVCVNPEFFFYKPSFTEVVGKDEVIRKVDICGVVLARLRRIAKTPQELSDEARRGPMFYYVLTLTAPVFLFDHDKKGALRPRGTIVWLDERHNFKSLRSMLPKVDPATGNVLEYVEVGIQPIGKVSTSSGNNVWKFSVLRWTHKAFDLKIADLDLLNSDEALALTSKEDKKESGEEGNSDIPFGSSGNHVDDNEAMGVDDEIPY